MPKDYPALYDDDQAQGAALAEAIPRVLASFNRMKESAVKDGALSHKTKELISLGISICARCDGCVASHVKRAREAGATREEIAEAIGVAVFMGAGPAVTYAGEAWLALRQYEATG
jgi:AhpD family alkylhydroperoxidase